MSELDPVNDALERLEWQEAREDAPERHPLAAISRRAALTGGAAALVSTARRRSTGLVTPTCIANPNANRPMAALTDRSESPSRAVIAVTSSSRRCPSIGNWPPRSCSAASMQPATIARASANRSDPPPVPAPSARANGSLMSTASTASANTGVRPVSSSIRRRSPSVSPAPSRPADAASR